jgi:hypothetical protein
MAIAETRANSIMRTLPPLKKAVEVISPDVAKLIVERDALEKKAQSLYDKLEEIGGPLDLTDMDQNMSVGALRKFIKDRDTKRKRLAFQLKEIGEETEQLNSTIGKKLYAGIPGLSDAVVDVVTSTYDKAKAFGELERRVSEKVMFGDSQTAMDIFRSFEADEEKVSKDIRNQLLGAVKALKLNAVPKKKKKK